MIFHSFLIIRSTLHLKTSRKFIWNIAVVDWSGVVAAAIHPVADKRAKISQVHCTEEEITHRIMTAVVERLIEVVACRWARSVVTKLVAGRVVRLLIVVESVHILRVVGHFVSCWLWRCWLEHRWVEWLFDGVRHGGRRLNHRVLGKKRMLVTGVWSRDLQGFHEDKIKILMFAMNVFMDYIWKLSSPS